jgi:hypothetical protein
VYFFLGGPGVDPGYNGTATEAYDWGEDEAGLATAYWDGLIGEVGNAAQYDVYGDVEPDYSVSGTEYSNGWNSQGNCGGRTSTTSPGAYLDRETFDGWYDYLSSVGLVPAVYSASSYWDSVLSGYNSITGTDEWTYQGDQSTVTPAPSGWSTTNTSAIFFGAQSGSSAHAVLWQWSQAGGDYDQLDTNH